MAPTRRESIEARMKARREREKASYYPDQRKPGWSKGMTWQEMLDARSYPHIHYNNL